MNASTQTFATYFNYIGSIELSREVVNLCSHSGDCTEDVKRCLNLPEIKEELRELDPAQLVKELREYGAWDDKQLTNHADNLERILWIAAGNISDSEEFINAEQ